MATRPFPDSIKLSEEAVACRVAAVREAARVLRERRTKCLDCYEAIRGLAFEVTYCLHPFRRHPDWPRFVAALRKETE